MFTVVRIYSDEKGDSHFEEISVPLKENGMVGSLSDAIAAKEVIFREVEPTYDWDFHTAPQKQYIILLDGEIEIETSLHQKRKFSAGMSYWLKTRQGKDTKLKTSGRSSENPFLLLSLK